MHNVYEYGLNQSQWVTWQKCRYLWHLEYQRGIARRFEGLPISIGTAVHNGLGAALVVEPKDAKIESERAINAWAIELLAKDDCTEEETAFIHEINERALAIASRTIDNLDLGHRWGTLFHDGKPLVEYRFEIPIAIGGWSKFHGTLDWVAVDLDTGRVWLTDHKVRATFMPEVAEEFNIQMAIYKHLLNKQGVGPIYGSMMHQIKSAVPKNPKINKNGTISRAAVLSDWPHYKQFCIDNGQNPDDYLDMKAKLADAEWFRMTQFYWPDSMVEAIWRNLEEGARAIGFESMPRSIGYMTCNTCRLRDFCQAEMRGDDTDFLLKTQFKLKDEENTKLPTDFED